MPEIIKIYLAVIPMHNNRLIWKTWIPKQRAFLSFSEKDLWITQLPGKGINRTLKHFPVHAFTLSYIFKLSNFMCLLKTPKNLSPLFLLELLRFPKWLKKKKLWPCSQFLYLILFQCLLKGRNGRETAMAKIHSRNGMKRIPWRYVHHSSL